MNPPRMKPSPVIAASELTSVQAWSECGRVANPRVARLCTQDEQELAYLKILGSSAVLTCLWHSDLQSGELFRQQLSDSQ